MTENNKKKLLGLLGIARKANALTIGASSTVEAIRSPSPKAKEKSTIMLVLIASDAAKNARKRLKDSSDYYGIKYIETDIDSFELGHATGKYDSAVCVGVTDAGFTAAILKIAANEGDKEGTEAE